MTIPKTPFELFDARWELNEETGCWLWTGAMFQEGYGHFSSHWQGRKWIELAHRASWILHKGPIPTDLCVCHHCDTPRCVNPAHLFLGTSRENTHDAVRKGRMNKPKGEKNVKAKLSEKDVLKIFIMKKLGLSAIEISKKFNVTDTSICNVLNRKTWKHLK